VRALLSLWSEKAEGFRGRFHEWDPVESNPKPVQPGGVPIVVGGHVEGAARRAARCADGFFPVDGRFGKLEPLLAALRDECARIGRDPAEIELTTGARKLDADTVRRYRDMGVSRLVTGPPAYDAEGLRRGLGELAELVAAAG